MISRIVYKYTRGRSHAVRFPASAFMDAYRTRPVGRPSRCMTASQASTQLAHPTHSSCSPLRISIPVGQTCTHRRQLMQSPAPVDPSRPGAPRGSPRAASYPMTIVLSSVNALWIRPYGQRIMQNCSRNQAKAPYKAKVKNITIPKASR